MFKTMPKQVQQSPEKKRPMEQTHGSDQYTAMRQMASLMGNQAMLGMMQSQGLYQKEQSPFFDDMRKKFGQKQEPERQASPTHRSSGGTSLPDYLREKFEKKSGLPMDDVRVHYNSDKPEQLDALAYTYGTDVYVGPGQEDHLEHELGHVVQQKQGVVRPTSQINGLPLNSMPELETAAELGTMPTSISGTAQSHAVIQRCGGGSKDRRLSKCPYCKGKLRPIDGSKNEGDGECARNAMRRLLWNYPFPIQNENLWNSDKAKYVESDFSNLYDVREPVLILCYSGNSFRPDKIAHVFCAESDGENLFIYSANDPEIQHRYPLTLDERVKSCVHLQSQCYQHNSRGIPTEHIDGSDARIPDYKLKYFTKDDYEAAILDIAKDRDAEWNGKNFEKDENDDSNSCCTIV